VTCADCTAAAKRPHYGFAEGCSGCCARAAARGPHFYRVRKAGALDRQYRALLQQFGLTHESVKAAAASDALAKVPA
jgi:hypothetical protein